MVLAAFQLRAVVISVVAESGRASPGETPCPVAPSPYQSGLSINQRQVLLPPSLSSPFAGVSNMPRGSAKPVDLTAATAKRDALVAKLAAAEEEVRVAEEAARDAGRPVLQAALERVKIAAMDKDDAKAIATAIGTHGPKAVASHLASLQPS